MCVCVYVITTDHFSFVLYLRPTYLYLFQHIFFSAGRLRKNSFVDLALKSIIVLHIATVSWFPLKV